GAADTRQVDADLMSAAGLGLDADKSEAAETLDHFIEAARFLPLVLVVGDDHLDAVVLVVADAALDVVAVAVEHALGDGHVLLEDLARLELHGQVAMGSLFLGDEDDAGGVAVEAVDDAGAIVAIQAAQVAEVVSEGIDERARPVPLGGVHYHVERLVDDGEIFV